ncbi:hypothetical protein [Ralstonia phage phiRSL1]|uniref:Uncharacterized protein n=1 Tax=Ralstonia phage phiRSL1 TaxID=1980924 RepID=B2ZXR5_9CAUD|nr:hypothetical protein RSL1_ORF050 [Ralstonia phage phiRSL1]BAG41496.1 hypothetical protein [Ralstonia phage phiRSL1]
MNIDEIYSSPPLFVNEEGVKWWPNDYSTQYAQAPDKLGTTLPNVRVYYVEMSDGQRRMAIVDHVLDQAVYDSQSLEAIAVYIDALKQLRREEQRAQIKRG